MSTVNCDCKQGRQFVRVQFVRLTNPFLSRSLDLTKVKSSLYTILVLRVLLQPVSFVEF